MSLATGALLSRGPRATRQATIATLVELTIGVLMSFVVLGVFAVAPSQSAWASPFTMPDGRPSPFVALLALTVVVVCAQAATGFLLARRSAWPRVLGMGIALVFAAVCLLFIGSIVFEFAAGLLTGTTPSMGDQFDRIVVFASLLPAALVLVLNLRAVYFAARELR